MIRRTDIGFTWQEGDVGLWAVHASGLAYGQFHGNVAVAAKT